MTIKDPRSDGEKKRDDEIHKYVEAARLRLEPKSAGERLHIEYVKARAAHSFHGPQHDCDRTVTLAHVTTRCSPGRPCDKYDPNLAPWNEIPDAFRSAFYTAAIMFERAVLTDYAGNILGIHPDDVCKWCLGLGRKMYGCTSAWKGGPGGAMMTMATCDGCWGTGDKSRPGPDLRARAAQMEIYHGLALSIAHADRCHCRWLEGTDGRTWHRCDWHRALDTIAMRRAAGETVKVAPYVEYAIEQSRDGKPRPGYLP